LIETEDTVDDTTVGRGVGKIDSRVLVQGSKGNAVERVQMVLGITEVDASGEAVYGPITIAAVQEWQVKNGLSTEIVTAVSDIDPSLRGTSPVLTENSADGIFDSDDWEILLTPPNTDRLLLDATKGVTVSDDVSMAGSVVDDGVWDGMLAGRKHYL
jgi:peptidoglycan hydrolase-like protein with peptidoglycan-binding domain